MQRAVLKTALAVATCMGSLAVWRAGVDHEKGIAPAIFAEAWGLRLWRTPPAPAVPLTEPEQPTVAANPEPAMQPSSPATAAKPVIRPSGPRPALSTYLFDDGGALDSFFDDLQQLETPGDAPERVAILHYGDSPTTADLITGDVRAMLQQRFGDAGHGYLLVDKPWAWYGHRDTDLKGDGWTIGNAVGKMRADTYGLGGASFQGNEGASSRITLKDGAQTAMVLEYLAQPNGGTVTVSGNGQELAAVDTEAGTRTPAWKTIPLPTGTRTVDLKVSSGHVELFGEEFRRLPRGVVYDSLGLNGASTTVLSRGLNGEVWSAELRHEAPALVIINYGTNESSFGAFVDKQYEGELRLAIGRIRNALPDVSILIMSPMDRGERSGIDQISTMATIPRIVALQKQVAADTHCAFFDTFDAMGGDGTMSRWYTGKPRLVSADLIHPTPQGAAMVAQIFVKNLMQGYDIYKKTHTQPVRTETTTGQVAQP
ncbi:MAG TPA: GDSL-type esterase/lipase family protein [Granulicella sp.]